MVARLTVDEARAALEALEREIREREAWVARVDHAAAQQAHGRAVVIGQIEAFKLQAARYREWLRTASDAKEQPPKLGPVLREAGPIPSARGSIEFGYLNALPFAVPPVPSYVIPERGDGASCTYVVEDDGRVVHVASGTIIEGRKGWGDQPARIAWRDHCARGMAEHRCVIGIKGNGGMAVIGGHYDDGGNDPVDVTSPNREPIRVQFVGLTEVARIGVRRMWKGAKFRQPVAELLCTRIGLRGDPNTACIFIEGPSRLVVVDSCWFLPSTHWAADGTFHEPETPWYAHGLHVGGASQLVVANTQDRGFFPSDPGLRFREHVVYRKEGDEAGEDAGQWFLHNTGGDSNRTLTQHRPQSSDQPERFGDQVYAGNLSIGRAWSFPSLDGGSNLSEWSCPNGDTFWIGNVLLDSRGGCIFAGGQEPARDVLSDAGFAVGPQYLLGNKTSNPRSQREGVVFSGVQEVHDFGGNDWGNCRVNLGNKWGKDVHGKATGRYLFHGDKSEAPALEVWAPSRGKTVALGLEDAARLGTLARAELGW